MWNSSVRAEKSFFRTAIPGRDIFRLLGGESLTLALNGTVEKKYPYKLELTGGNIADLVTW